jgi:uncharacterized protein with ParB-like and HNH nuclease domain
MNGGTEMSDLLGIISPLKKLLSNTDEVITVRANGTNQNILALNKNRKFIIPDFQREIRWDCDNLSQLIDDIKSGPKYMGNIILTKICNEDRYLIIDGQQRITTITMILCCLNNIHDGKIESIIPCTLSVESFMGFEELVCNKFVEESRKNSKIRKTDKLYQIDKYYELWDCMSKNTTITNKVEAKKFLDNLFKSKVNIILNESDDMKDGIRYFIDVNLKGKQLDTEDIFKGYLFRNDSSKEIRDAWYNLKTKTAIVDEKKIKYPLLKLLEHYFYCDLYNDKKYKGLNFDEEFLLTSEFILHEETTSVFRMKTHFIEVIDDKDYMIASINRLNTVIDVIIDIVDTEAPSTTFKNFFKKIRGNDKIDVIEMSIIHNFMKKILKDDKILPKALFMKYILTVFLNENKKEKKEFRKVYGVYLLAVLFIIFENKKSKDSFLNILKASSDKWFDIAIEDINSYFKPGKITDNKITSQLKQGLNEDEEDYQFRCKSLATIYNFFMINEGEVQIIKPLDELKQFVTNDAAYTTEHFIVSQTKQKSQKVVTCEGKTEKETEYLLNEDIYKRYVNNLFNFIFIDNKLNGKLGNYWLPKKIEVINAECKEFKCEYSKMVIENLSDLANSMKMCASSENYKRDLDLFFYQEFKEKYIEYSRRIINSVINKINNK